MQCFAPSNIAEIGVVSSFHVVSITLVVCPKKKKLTYIERFEILVGVGINRPTTIITELW